MLARFSLVLLAVVLAAEQVPVRLPEGRIHGFLVLRNLEGNIMASGELTQVASGSRVTSELTFRFKDGSLHQETAVYSQRRLFHLISYRQVQKGKTFKRPTEMTINTSTGQVKVIYSDDDGEQKTIQETMELPPDLSNGMVSTLLGDIGPKVAKSTLSMVVATPKPRIVKLEITPQGEDAFTVGGATHKATRYNVKVEIGGITGVIAPIVGKQPPDTHVWMVTGKAPGFVRSEGPMCDGCPIWRIELASPLWPKSQSTTQLTK